MTRASVVVAWFTAGTVFAAQAPALNSSIDNLGKFEAPVRTAASAPTWPGRR